MFHLDDEFRAARGLYMTQKEVGGSFLYCFLIAIRC